MKSQLPIELLELVSSYTDPYTLLQARASSKLFLNILQDKHIWERSGYYNIHSNIEQDSPIGDINGSSSFIQRLVKIQRFRDFCLSAEANDPLIRLPQDLLEACSSYIYPIAGVQMGQFARLESANQTSKVTIHDISSSSSHLKTLILATKHTITSCTEFLKEERGYLIALDQSRKLQIFDMASNSNATVRPIHSVSLPSHQTTLQMFIMRVLPDIDAQSPLMGRRIRRSLSDQQLTSTFEHSSYLLAKEMILKAESILVTLSQEQVLPHSPPLNVQRLEFRPIWFDLLDFGPYGGHSYYPFIERDAHFSVELPLSICGDNPIIKCWSFDMRFSDDTKTKSWCTAAITKSGNSIVIGVFRDTGTKIDVEWSSIHLNTDCAHQMPDIVTAELCVDPRQRNFMNLLLIKSSSGCLFRFNLKKVLDSILLNEASSYNVSPDYIIGGEYVFQTITAEFESGLVFANARKKDGNQQFIVCVDLYSQVFGYTADPVVICAKNNWNIKKMVFVCDQKVNWPTLVVETKTGSIYTVPLSRIIQPNTNNEKQPSVKMCAQHKTSNIIARWIDEIDF